jgi:hypothetical protein
VLGGTVTLRDAAADASSGELDVTATSTSDAFVAWHNFTTPAPNTFRKVEVRRIAANSSPGTLLFPTSAAGSTGVRVEPNASGGVLLAWRESGIRAQSIAANDTLGALETPTASASAGPALATDGSDHFRVVYRAGTSPYTLAFRPLSPSGTPGSARILDPVASELIGLYDIATNQANRSLVAWRRATSADIVKARFIGSDDNPEADTFTAPDPTSAQDGASAALGASVGVVGFVSIPGTNRGTAWGRILPATGTPPAPVALSSQIGGASAPIVGVAPSDVGIAAWRENPDFFAATPHARIFARQVLPPPVCADRTATVVQGRPRRIALGCTGLQLTAPKIVTSSKHGRVTAPAGVVPDVIYTPTPGYEGPDSFTFRGRNPGGTGDLHTVTLTVHRDTVKPKITKLELKPKPVPLPFGKKSPAFRLAYSERAVVKITVQRRRTCPSAKPKCKRFAKVEVLRTVKPSRSARVKLKRKVAGRQVLLPGRHRATAVARDPAGNRSTPRRLTFEVVARSAAAAR